MECGICNESIEENDGFLRMGCTHHAHLNCFMKGNFLHMYHGNLARLHCSTCQEQVLSNDFIAELNEEIDDTRSTDQEEKMLEEHWNNKPQIKERLKKAKVARAAYTKANKAFSTLTRTTLETLKKDTADTIHVLKGMYKAAFTKLTQSEEAKAVKSARMSYARLFDRIYDDFNSNRWFVHRFLRNKGYNFGRMEYRAYLVNRTLRRKFSVKLI